MDNNDRGKICLVIDLDETLVHSAFRPVPNADFIVPVEIDEQVHQVSFMDIWLILMPDNEISTCLNRKNILIIIVR